METGSVGGLGVVGVAWGGGRVVGFRGLGGFGSLENCGVVFLIKKKKRQNTETNLDSYTFSEPID